MIYVCPLCGCVVKEGLDAGFGCSTCERKARNRRQREDVSLCLSSDREAVMTPAFFDALPVRKWPERLEVGKAYKQQWGDRWFYCEPTKGRAVWVPITVTP